MRYAVAALAAVLILAATVAAEQQTATIVFSEPPTAAPKAAKAVSSDKVSKRIGFLQRRKLGLNFGNVLRVTREMNAAGELDIEHPDAMAAQVLQRIMDENPEAFQKALADRDWASFFEALLAFLEQILPLIFQLFALSPPEVTAVAGPCFLLAA